MNKEEFKVTHIINIPREEINCSRCKHWGEQTCVPYGFGCQYEPTFPHRSPRLSQAQLNKINEIVRNLQQENKHLKDKWNNLKEWVFGEKMTFYKAFDGSSMIRHNDLCNKIRELEKSDSNE